MRKFTQFGTMVLAVLSLALAADHAAAQPAGPPAGGAGAPGGPGGTTAPGGAPAYGTPTPTVFTSKIGFFTMERDAGAQYPRVIQLKFGPNKGALLATYSHRGNLPIWRSTDNGDSWTPYSEVPQLRGQPCIYELPVKMGEFPA